MRRPPVVLFVAPSRRPNHEPATKAEITSIRTIPTNIYLFIRARFLACLTSASILLRFACHSKMDKQQAPRTRGLLTFKVVSLRLYDDQGPHHVVLLVLQYVAVPNVLGATGTGTRRSHDDCIVGLL